MQLKTDSSRALAAWLRPDTWHTNHTLDMKRFYNFVDEYAKEHGSDLDEDALIEEIYERLERMGRSTDALQKITVTRVYLARSILEFLEQSGR